MSQVETPDGLGHRADVAAYQSTPPEPAGAVRHRGGRGERHRVMALVAAKSRIGPPQLTRTYVIPASTVASLRHPSRSDVVHSS